GAKNLVRLIVGGGLGEPTNSSFEYGSERTSSPKPIIRQHQSVARCHPWTGVHMLGVTGVIEAQTWNDTPTLRGLPLHICVPGRAKPGAVGLSLKRDLCRQRPRRNFSLTWWWWSPNKHV